MISSYALLSLTSKILTYFYNIGTLKEYVQILLRIAKGIGIPIAYSDEKQEVIIIIE